MEGFWILLGFVLFIPMMIVAFTLEDIIEMIVNGFNERSSDKKLAEEARTERAKIEQEARIELARLELETERERNRHRS